MKIGCSNLLTQTGMVILSCLRYRRFKNKLFVILFLAIFQPTSFTLMKTGVFIWNIGKKWMEKKAYLKDYLAIPRKLFVVEPIKTRQNFLLHDRVNFSSGVNYCSFYLLPFLCHVTSKIILEHVCIQLINFQINDNTITVAMCCWWLFLVLLHKLT